MSAWRSTEDAPRDGTWILGRYADRCRVVRWRSGRSVKRYEGGVLVFFWSDGYFRHGDPEAWMPLPAHEVQARAA